MKYIKIKNYDEDDSSSSYLPIKKYSEQDLMNTQRLILKSCRNSFPVNQGKYFSFQCVENLYAEVIPEKHISCFVFRKNEFLEILIVSFTIVMGDKPYVLTKKLDSETYNWLPIYQYRIALGYQALQFKTQKFN
jgi:hypothetical protein